MDAFKEAFNAVLDRKRGEPSFVIWTVHGLAPLREQLLPLSYELWHQNLSENVQIISGAQQGIDIISKAMLRYGDVVFVEKPTFYGAAGAFLSRKG